MLLETDIKTSTKPTVERQLDIAIYKIQYILNNASNEQIDTAFSMVFNRFEYFIKKIVSNYYITHLDNDDIMQEATVFFYNSILSYDINKGAFIVFSRTFVTRNILNLVTKSSKHKKGNNCLVSLDTYSNDRNNFDDYLFSQITNKTTLEHNLIVDEQVKDYLDKVHNYLTEKEKKAMLLYLKGSSYVDIATTCNLCEKSIDNSLHRAKTKLKNICNT